VIFSHLKADIQKQPKARRTLRQLHPAATNGGNNANMTGYHGLKQTCRQLQFEFGPLIDNWVRTVIPIEEAVAYLDTFHPAQDASLPYVRKANLIIDKT
jgi:hypothetical protein